jgi:general secretion pathway protein L
MFTDIYTWWKEQMRDLLPASIQLCGRSWRKVLVVKADSTAATEVELSLHGRGGQTSLGRHSWGADLKQALATLSNTLTRAAVLQVPTGLLLERQVVLPLAAEMDLEGVVAHEMDRLTPFRAADIVWDATIARRDMKRGQIHVRVSIVPKLHLQPMLEALRQSGLAPTQIRAQSASEERTILLCKSGAKRAWPGPRTLQWMQAGCGILAAVAIALPFILQSLEEKNIDDRIAAMRPQLTEADKLRNTIAGSTTSADLITRARNEVGNPLQSIALLTDMLPDDTYLTLLSFHQRKMSVNGRSAVAARLVGALAANPLLHNPAFAAPVLRDETSGGETFSIRVEVGS